MKSTRIFTVLLLLLTALLFTTACEGDDNDDINNNNAANPTITLTHKGQTTTAGLSGFGTSMPIGTTPLVIATNAHTDAGGTRTLVTTSLILHNPAGTQAKTGEYTLYKEGDEPGDDQPFAWLMLTGATAAGLPAALQATSGTLKVEVLAGMDSLLIAADYTFTATFQDVHEVDETPYEISGTVKHTNKMPTD